MTIPQANPGANYRAHKARIDAAIAAVLASGRYILGPEVEAFERELGAFVSRGAAVGVASGTDALQLALRAAGVGAGDEVVTVSHTAVATIAAIELAGARPVLVDIDPVSFTMSPPGFESAITPKTRAVIPVHVYGHPADMDAILRVARPRGIHVIEDCAQSLGARYRGVPCGSIGDLAAFSFYPTKNLGAIGDGGALVAADDHTTARARSIRQYGWAKRYISDVPGLNTRLDELQAAILRVKLEALASENARRAVIATRYRAALESSRRMIAPSAPSGAGSLHAWHLFVVRTADREALIAHLDARGVGHAIHYPVPVHLQPAYLETLRGVDLPETERASREILSLPLWPEMSDAEVETVARSLADFRA